ncbi:MAG: Na+/H+ antiporter subunit C [Anaerolineae bacterium]|nr:Na+/H+ antiporter subunit C [Anaerolineae bacterium]
MTYLLAILIGALFSAGLYMMMRRSLVKILIGLLLLSNAVNLLIFTAGRLVPGRPPLIPAGAELPEAPFADPLPQALILTAIVISFGVAAFAIVLIRQTYQKIGTDDLNELRCTDLPCSMEIEEPAAEKEGQ